MGENVITETTTLSRNCSFQKVLSEIKFPLIQWSQSAKVILCWSEHVMLLLNLAGRAWCLRVSPVNMLQSSLMLRGPRWCHPVWNPPIKTPVWWQWLDFRECRPWALCEVVYEPGSIHQQHPSVGVFKFLSDPWSWFDKSRTAVQCPHFDTSWITNGGSFCICSIDQKATLNTWET